jgi:alkylation response protein AidB-like acyl-CoA dehydrogenase
MDLTFTPAELAFRDEVRDFLARKLDPELAARVRNLAHLSREDYDGWHAVLNEQGWLAPHWPVEYGGTGWDVVRRFIFDDECNRAFAPRIVPFGLNMLAPVLIRYGTEAQKQYYLPRILDGSDFWCQGYSEPGAGSDLASLKCAAVRDGDHYVVNGQKTWTTLGHYANRMFVLVRTSSEGKPQQGISFLLVDMESPGVDVRPLITLDGRHEVNEVFFTDVRVPVDNLVGEENRGWDCAKYLLTYERTNSANVGASYAALERLKAAAATRTRNGRPLTEDPLFAARLARVEIELDNMSTTNLRVIAAVAGGGAPGAESSILKILGTEVAQEISNLARMAMGPGARALRREADDADGSPLTREDRAALNYFNLRKLTIFAGSNEIQKNIIAKMMLHL